MRATAVSLKGRPVNRPQQGLVSSWHPAGGIPYPDSIPELERLEARRRSQLSHPSLQWDKRDDIFDFLDCSTNGNNSNTNSTNGSNSGSQNWSVSAWRWGWVLVDGESQCPVICFTPLGNINGCMY